MLLVSSLFCFALVFDPLFVLLKCHFEGGKPVFVLFTFYFFLGRRFCLSLSFSSLYFFSAFSSTFSRSTERSSILRGRDVRSFGFKCSGLDGFKTVAFHRFFSLSFRPRSRRVHFRNSGGGNFFTTRTFFSPSPSLRLLFRRDGLRCAIPPLSPSLLPAFTFLGEASRAVCLSFTMRLHTV